MFGRWRRRKARQLTDQEFRALLERRVRERFNMSLDEFVRAVEDGRLDSPDVTDLAILVGARTGQVS
jgi:cytochrome P450